MGDVPNGRVLGVGGVFFRSPAPSRLADWYRDTLGLAIESWGETRGTSFAPGDMPEHSFTVWSVFAADTEYFGNASQSFMINFVVDDIDKALTRVQFAGGEVLPEREDGDYGRFAWFIDPDGNKVELWQPPREVPDSPENGDASR